MTFINNSASEAVVVALILRTVCLYLAVPIAINIPKLCLSKSLSTPSEQELDTVAQQVMLRCGRLMQRRNRNTRTMPTRDAGPEIKR